MIAQYADVSRGAMMHHFPSRASVLESTIEHIHQIRLAEYRRLMSNIGDVSDGMTRAAIEQCIERTWQYVNLPASIAFMEVVTASRTNKDLQAILQPLVDEFERHFLSLIRVLFPQWQDSQLLETAHDLVHLPLLGMVSSPLQVIDQKRIEQVLSALADNIEAMYTVANLGSKAKELTQHVVEV